MKILMQWLVYDFDFKVLFWCGDDYYFINDGGNIKHVSSDYANGLLRDAKKFIIDAGLFLPK